MVRSLGQVRPGPGVPGGAVLHPRAACSGPSRPAAASSTPSPSWASPAPGPPSAAAAEDVVAAAHAAGAERVCVGLGVSNAGPGPRNRCLRGRRDRRHRSGGGPPRRRRGRRRGNSPRTSAPAWAGSGRRLEKKREANADPPPRCGHTGPRQHPEPVWSGFDIPLPWGTLRIHAYALCILAGIIVGLWLTSARWKRRAERRKAASGTSSSGPSRSASSAAGSTTCSPPRTPTSAPVSTAPATCR